MRYCLILRGVSFNDDKDFYHYMIDYKKSYNNIREKIIDPLVSQGHEVDVILSTNIHAHLDQLIEDYKSAVCITTDSGHNVKLFAALQYYAEKYEKECDYVIVTRFDMHFTKSILDLPINYNHFNIMCRGCNVFYYKGKVYDDIDDNFFVFPGVKLYVANFAHLFKTYVVDRPAYNTGHYMLPFLEEGGIRGNVMYETKHNVGKDGTPYFLLERQVVK